MARFLRCDSCGLDIPTEADPSSIKAQRTYGVVSTKVHLNFGPKDLREHAHRQIELCRSCYDILIGRVNAFMAERLPAGEAIRWMTPP